MRLGDEFREMDVTREYFKYFCPRQPSIRLSRVVYTICRSDGEVIRFESQPIWGT
jgi:hypothetical protein